MFPSDATVCPVQDPERFCLTCGTEAVHWGDEFVCPECTRVAPVKPPPEGPTDAAPGTAEKVAILTERAGRRLRLFHPDDADNGTVPFLPSLLRRGGTHARQKQRPSARLPAILGDSVRRAALDDAVRHGLTLRPLAERLGCSTNTARRALLSYRNGLATA